MKEIGGYFELERLVYKPYYKDLIEFNSSRNCLLYILKKRKIKKIYLPYLLCDVITDVCEKNNIEIEFYSIDENLLPMIDCDKINSNSYLYIINYYGLFDNKLIQNLKKKYDYIIVDNTHSFFQKPIKNIDTIYNCRKYFGVPDGAYLSTDLEYNSNIKKGKSGFRMKHLIGRFEGSASDYYNDFREADESFDNEEILYMSELTKNILGAIDYNRVNQIRKRNFNNMHNQLKQYNKFKSFNQTCNFMYPFYFENSENLRKYLIENKIYVPILWPNVLEDCDEEMFEYDFVKNVIPIPIDQRYNDEDINYMSDLILNFIKNRRN